jgi:NAD(P)-dependent dehydrogenase (short-subunit alcohol dehydrogenase family)
MSESERHLRTAPPSEAPVTIVTGAASGVGAATARLLAAQGVEIVGIDRRWEDDSVPGLRVEGDVTEQTTWARAAAATPPLGELTGLVIGAGHLSIGPLLEVDDESIRRVFEVNVFGAVLGLKACLPTMIARGGGSVVAVASVNALLAEQGLTAYSASKGALLQLIRGVAVDYARAGIRANCVCPAAIDTPMFRRHVGEAADPDAFLEETAARHPDGRIRTPEEVAEVVAFLIDERSRGLTGTTVTVDGGLTSTFDYQSSAVNREAAPHRRDPGT